MTTQNVTEKMLALIEVSTRNQDAVLEVMANMVWEMQEMERRIVKLENESNENRPGVTTNKA